MGLDNGIYIKGDAAKAFPEIIKRTEYIPYDNIYEVAYWRKCWNVRDLIFDVLCDNNHCPGNNRDCGDYLIDRDDLYDIADELAAFDEESWNDGGSIWDWEDSRIEEKIAYDVATIRWLAAYCETHPELENYIYFYDSY